MNLAKASDDFGAKDDVGWIGTRIFAKLRDEADVRCSCRSQEHPGHPELRSFRLNWRRWGQIQSVRRGEWI